MKRSVKTLILLGVLVVLVGGYFLIGQLTTTQNVSEEAGNYPLSALTAETLTGVQWTLDGETIHLVKNEDGEWTNADNAAFPVNQSAVEAIAEDVVALTATRKLENIGELADYGLSEPTFTLVAESAAGSVTYAMGAETPFADGYYVSVSNEEGVLYTVENSLSDTFGQSLTALAELETIPTAENYNRLVIGTALDATYSDESLTIDPAQHWYAGGEPLDGDAVETLAESLAALAWNTLVTFDADSEAMSTYGLAEDEALTVALYEGDTLLRSVLLGGTDASGNVYARLPNSTMVYTVTSSNVSELMSATPDTLYQPQLLALAFEDVAEMRYTLGEGAQEHVLMRTENADESGTSADAETDIATATTEEAASVSVTMDGTAIDSETASTAYALLTALNATERTNAASQGASLLTVTVTAESDTTLSIMFCEYDAEHYLATDGTRALLVEADTVDRLIRTWKQLG